MRNLYSNTDTSMTETEEGMKRYGRWELRDIQFHTTHFQVILVAGDAMGMTGATFPTTPSGRKPMVVKGLEHIEFTILNIVLSSLWDRLSRTAIVAMSRWSQSIKHELYDSMIEMSFTNQSRRRRGQRLDRWA